MKKLISGIVEFRKTQLAEYRKKFSNLANRPSADALFVACCDSRVVPNTFASTDPGDLFVLRNIGNLISPYHQNESLSQDESAIAAIEFSIEYLKVKDIIVCGHSECAAMKAVVEGRETVSPPHLRNWLRYAEPAYEQYQQGFRLNSELTTINQVSQINVLQQIEHLKTYPIIQNAVSQQQLALHGWWFELETANVYEYKQMEKHFTLIDQIIS